MVQVDEWEAVSKKPTFFCGKVVDILGDDIFYTSFDKLFSDKSDKEERDDFKKTFGFDFDDKEQLRKEKIKLFNIVENMARDEVQNIIDVPNECVKCDDDSVTVVRVMTFKGERIFKLCKRCAIVMSDILNLKLDPESLKQSNDNLSRK